MLLDKELRDAESVVILGVGGGGDVSWSIPIINRLHDNGIHKIAVGEPSVAWWDLEGRISLGCFTFRSVDLSFSKRISPGCSMISPKSRVTGGPGKGAILPQSIVAELMDIDPYIIGIDRGVKGMVDDLEALCRRRGADLVLGVDCGSDSLYSGKESKVLSPLVDAMVMAALSKIEEKSMLGLIGYGCDGDLMPEEIDARLAELARENGILGSMGLSEEDKENLDAFFKRFPNPVEEWPLKASRGTHGWVRFNSLWSIYVCAFSSIMFMLDPKVMTEQNPLAKGIVDSRSLAEAERVSLSMGLTPETKLVKLLPKLLE